MMARLHELFLLLRHAWRLWRAGSEAFDDDLLDAYTRAWERVDESVLVVTVTAPEDDYETARNSVHFRDPRRRVH